MMTMNLLRGSTMRLLFSRSPVNMASTTTTTAPQPRLFSSSPLSAGGAHHHDHHDDHHHEPLDPYYDNTPAPHAPGAVHSKVAYVMGTVLWLWIFWRAKQDAGAMFGFRHPWEHAH